MKNLIIIMIFALTSSAFASVEFNDNLMQRIAHNAAVKTDLFFCFKAELGGRVSGDQVLDQVILASCADKAEEAIRLGITDDELEEVFIEAKQAVDKEKAKKRVHDYFN